MGGCCLGALLLSLGPRFFLFGAWLTTNWYNAFESGLLAFIAWVFMPWTSLAWMYVYFNNQGSLSGEYLIIFIIGVVLDVGAWKSSQTASSSDDDDDEKTHQHAKVEV